VKAVNNASPTLIGKAADEVLPVLVIEEDILFLIPSDDQVL